MTDLQNKPGTERDEDNTQDQSIIFKPKNRDITIGRGKIGSPANINIVGPSNAGEPATFFIPALRHFDSITLMLRGKLTRIQCIETAPQTWRVTADDPIKW
jgi:hypothetical protein